MDKIIHVLRKYGEAIRYLFWGVLTTVVGWGSYSLFVLVFDSVFADSLVTITVANIFSWICAVIFAFVVNKVFVFESFHWNWEVVLPEATKFFSARLLTGALEVILVPLLVILGLNQSFFGIEGIVSKALVSVIVIVLNYVFCKVFIFKNK